MDRYNIVPMNKTGVWWFKQRLPMSLTDDALGIMGWKDGAIVAGVIFCHRTPHSVEAHQVIEDPLILRRGWLKMLGEAAFGYERRVVYSMISAANEKSRKFHKRLGFKESGIIPEAFGEGVDGIAVSLLRKDYPWLEENING